MRSYMLRKSVAISLFLAYHRIYVRYLRDLHAHPVGRNLLVYLPANDFPEVCTVQICLFDKRTSDVEILAEYTANLYARQVSADISSWSCSLGY